MSSTIWLKDVGYGAGGSMSPGVVSMLLREVESSLEGVVLVMEG